MVATALSTAPDVQAQSMLHSYDHIAAIYDADMGASMALPDLDYYVAAARIADGPVLELGCGTGRVLAALHANGIDAIGVDQSGPMLQQARARLKAGAALARMDIRQLALRANFALALLPYSLVTYLLSEDDWRQLAQGLHAALRPGARVLVDAFIPQPQLAGTGWIRDYARPLQGHFLLRHKRVTTLADGNHRIERRYRLAGAFGGRTLHTSERIRPYAPDDLVAMCQRHLGPVTAIDWDYGQASESAFARFCTVTVLWAGE